LGFWAAMVKWFWVREDLGNVIFSLAVIFLEQWLPQDYVR